MTIRGRKIGLAGLKPFREGQISKLHDCYCLAIRTRPVPGANKAGKILLRLSPYTPKLRAIRILLTTPQKE
jgi:hypothetical protein